MKISILTAIISLTILSTSCSDRVHQHHALQDFHQKHHVTHHKHSHESVSQHLTDVAHKENTYEKNKKLKKQGAVFSLY